MLDQNNEDQKGGWLSKWMSSPAFAIGAGLLANSGPSLTPTSFGSTLGKALQGAQAMGQQQLQSQMTQAQIESLKNDVDLKKTKLKQTKAMMKMFGLDEDNNSSTATSNLLKTTTDNLANNQAPQALPNMGMPQSSPMDSMPSNLSDYYANQVPGGQASQMQMGMPMQGSQMTSQVTPQVAQYAKMLAATGDFKGAIALMAKINPAPTMLPGGYIKDAMMGPARGGQGGTYTNSKTGELISSNTNTQTSVDQNAIAAVERIKPQIEDLVKNLPQFQRAITQGKAYAQGISNKYFGTDFDLPSQQAEGTALINTTAEGLMKAFNLPTTNESLDMVKTAISPKDGESPGGYQARVLRELQKVILFQNQAKGRLANGISLTQSNNPSSHQSQDLQAMAQDAIAKGADPQAVQQRMRQLAGGSQ